MEVSELLDRKATDFNQLMTDFKTAITNPQFASRSLKATTLLSLMAIGSGLLYFESSSSETSLLVNTTGQQWLAPANVMGNVITNTLFNAQGYFTLHAYKNHPLPTHVENFLGPQNNTADWAMAFVVGFFTLLPITAQGWDPSNNWNNAINVMSSLLNLPIYALGGKFLIEDTKKLTFHQPCASSKHRTKNASTERTQMIAKLESLLHDIKTSPQKRNDLIEDIKTFENLDLERLTACVGASIDNDLNQSNTSSHLSLFIFTMGFLAFYQNFGYTMVGGQSGVEFGQQLDLSTPLAITCGFVFGLCNLIPSLGFSIDGVRTIRSLLTDPLSISGQFAKYKLAIATTLVCVMALFSGTTSGAVNRRGVCLLQGINETNTQANDACLHSGVAWASAILGNLGAALPYNGPQALLFSISMFQRYFEQYGDPEQRQVLALEKQLDQLINVMKSIKDQDFTDIQSSNSYGSNLA